jgi:hypothetical protein
VVQEFVCVFGYFHIKCEARLYVHTERYILLLRAREAISAALETRIYRVSLLFIWSVPTTASEYEKDAHTHNGEDK